MMRASLDPNLEVDVQSSIPAKEWAQASNRSGLTNSHLSRCVYGYTNLCLLRLKATDSTTKTD